MEGIGVNWDHLTYFQKVAEMGSFTLAAKELYLTTAALSKAIRNLEKEIGFPLFEKQGRNSVLTEYGAMFNRNVTTALRELDKGLQEVYTRVGLVKGLVRISGVWTMMSGFLPERIKAFHALYPDVTFHTKYRLTYQVLRSVIDKVADIGLCGDFIVEDEDYSEVERTLLYTEKLFMIAPKNHWLARREYVDFGELRDELFVSFQAVNAGGVYEAFWELCCRHDFQPKIAFEASDDHVIIAFVGAGLGIALMPDSPYLPLPQDKVVSIPFKENFPVRHQYLIWRKNRYLSPVAKAFRDFIISTTLPANPAPGGAP